MTEAKKNPVLPNALVADDQGVNKPLRSGTKLTRNKKHLCWGKPISVKHYPSPRVTKRESTKLKRTAVVETATGKRELKQVKAHTRWLNPDEKTPVPPVRQTGERLSVREGNRWRVPPPADDSETTDNDD